MISIRPGVWEDVDRIGPLRKADNEELTASLGLPPEIAIRYSWSFPGERNVILKDGKVIALFGCAGSIHSPNLGVPWLLGTDDLNHAGKTLVKYGRIYCDSWLKIYDILFNFVDVRHKPAIKWAKRVGFKILKAERHGYDGKLFHKIVMEKSHV